MRKIGKFVCTGIIALAVVGFIFLTNFSVKTMHSPRSSGPIGGPVPHSSNVDVEVDAARKEGLKRLRPSIEDMRLNKAEETVESRANLDDRMKEDKKIKELATKVAELPKGKIVLDAPTNMKVGETRAVHANVGINVPIDVLRKYIRENTQKIEAPLKVSHEMSASLTGENFKITATTPEKQSVAEGLPTVWSWSVEAEKEGNQELEATLYVLLPTPNAAPQRVDSFKHTIGVTVKPPTLLEWLKSSKELIETMKVIVLAVGGAATAALGWLQWGYRRRKKIEKAHPAARP